MENIYKKYFKTIEFAETCCVTKHTLFHYDNIGILKPEAVAKNGYRYYSINQFLTLLKEKKKDLEAERIKLS